MGEATGPPAACPCNREGDAYGGRAKARDRRRGHRGPAEPAVPRDARERPPVARAPRRQDAAVSPPRGAPRQRPRRGLPPLPQTPPPFLSIQEVPPPAGAPPSSGLTLAPPLPRRGPGSKN